VVRYSRYRALWRMIANASRKRNRLAAMSLLRELYHEAGDGLRANRYTEKHA
jgi:hypothetical protein